VLTRANQGPELTYRDRVVDTGGLAPRPGCLATACTLPAQCIRARRREEVSCGLVRKMAPARA
ncbi:MAG: hypothetical protein ACRD0H_20860, partial [Actinomycetes bacterium]